MTVDSSLPAPASTTPRENPIRVMLVDDSAVIRSLMFQILATDPGITVSASAANGQTAIQLFSKADIQVIVLDIEMPVMDGLSAIPKLLEIDPDVKIIIASTLTLRNAEISMKALELGAADYIPKPTTPRDISAEGDFKRELLAKVRSHGTRPRTRPRTVAVADHRTPMPVPVAVPHAPRKIVLRRPGLLRPQVIAIGSSTGGPQALFTLLRGLPTKLSVPIVITQHMPPTFTAVLAQHIERICGRPCHEASEGGVLAPGGIYVAPGDHHLLIQGTAAKLVARLSRDPAENYCRPSVDPMMRSLIQALGGRVLGIMLTGMGSDGLAGSRRLVEAGGTLLAQDEATSVVWGMPGAVATAGLCTAVLPLPELAPYVIQLFEKSVS
jgi:two-component system, chemotaxis family, protein-glutamate methylesterase/glutaminase